MPSSLARERLDWTDWLRGVSLVFMLIDHADDSVGGVIVCNARGSLDLVKVEISVIMMALLLVADPTRRRADIWTAIGSAIWFVLLVMIAVPMVRATSVHMDQISRFGYLEGSPAQVLANLVAHSQLVLNEMSRPEKIGYLLHLFAPVGYLPAFAPVMLLPVLPTLVMNHAAITRRPALHPGAPARWLSLAEANRRLSLAMQWVGGRTC